MTRQEIRGASLGRRQPSKALSARLWVYCEGKNTEPAWLDWLNQRLRGVLLEIVPVAACGVPKTLVGRAVEKAREIRKRGRADMAARDEVWVVFDRDEHPEVPSALLQARDNGLGVAFSNPCFELWPLLHVGDHSAWSERGALQSRLRAAHPRYNHDKGARIEWDQLFPAHGDALRRAIQIHLRAIGAGDHLTNPTTTAWMLVERVRNANDGHGAWFVDLARQHRDLIPLVDLLPEPVRGQAKAEFSGA